MRDLFLFDCFGVVVGEVIPAWLKDIAGENAAALKEEYLAPGDRGEKDIRQIVKEFSQKFGLAADRIVEDWRGRVRINEELCGIIRALGKDNAVALVSNASEGYMQLLGIYNMLRSLFDKVFISGELKTAKPEPDIFRIAISSFGEKFGRVFMTDDNPANFVNLAPLGITPVLFRSAGGLRERLYSCGVRLD